MIDSDIVDSRAALGTRIDAAMQERGVSIRDLARKLEITYEHARRLARGEAVPSSYLLKAVCAYLKLPYEELQNIATSDRIRKKYGTLPLELTGKNPELDPIERAWPYLTDDQKKTLITLAQALVQQNTVGK